MTYTVMVLCRLYQQPYDNRL